MMKDPASLILLFSALVMVLSVLSASRKSFDRAAFYAVAAVWLLLLAVVFARNLV